MKKSNYSVRDFALSFALTCVFVLVLIVDIKFAGKTIIVLFQSFMFCIFASSSYCTWERKVDYIDGHKELYEMLERNWPKTFLNDYDRFAISSTFELYEGAFKCSKLKAVIISFCSGLCILGITLRGNENYSINRLIFDIEILIVMVAFHAAVTIARVPRPIPFFSKQYWKPDLEKDYKNKINICMEEFNCDEESVPYGYKQEISSEIAEYYCEKIYESIKKDDDSWEYIPPFWFIHLFESIFYLFVYNPLFNLNMFSISFTVLSIVYYFADIL